MNYKSLLKNKSRPYFYLPKIEHYKEARLWDEIFTFSEKAFDLPLGTIRATVLIETLPAAFQMNEISREAGGLGMLFILKSSILFFVLLMFIQVISKIISDRLGSKNDSWIFFNCYVYYYINFTYIWFSSCFYSCRISIDFCIFRRFTRNF